MRTRFRDGKLNERLVEVDMPDRATPIIEVFSASGMEEMDMQIRDLFGNMLPKKTKKRKVKVKDAYEFLTQEESKKLIDMDKVVRCHGKG